MSIANLNRPADAFEQLETEDGVRQGVCHIRIQQRTGRKTITTVQGVGTEYDLKRIVQYLKKLLIFSVKMVRSSVRLLVFLSIFRLASVYIVSSWFVPDEIYQSSEVAHNLVYGTGHLSWEWRASLRSYFHPALIAAIYQLINYIGLGSYSWIIYNVPRIFHSLLFVVADFSYYKLCRRLCITSKIADMSFISYLSCWFVFYCSSRTLSNSLETSITLIALSWFPFEGKFYKGSTWPYIALGIITIVIRPTVALIWLVFGLYHLYLSPNPFRLIFRVVVPVAFPILLLTIIIDSWAYGQFTIPLWNFLQFNVFQGGSAFFGVHPWHWYFTAGIPTVLTIQIIPIIIGLLGPNIFRPTLLPFYATSLYILVHSFLPHKEQRFLLPIIPLLCIYAGGAFQNLKKWQPTAVGAMIFINFIVVIFTSRYHQVGPFAAPKRIIEEWRGPGPVSIAALMPCYSLPGHAYLHNDLKTLRLLDCSPDFENLGKLDEADEFHENPLNWLMFKFEKEHKLYDRILMYEKIYEKTHTWFDKFGWNQCIEKIWHSFALTSSREDNYMIKHSCNGTIVEHPEYGEVIQLSGDQREKVKDFLIKVGIVNESNCRVHGF
ncbi:unnamed protein product [Caenorhabditis angaria]|uniref:Mannosyltransferase n=1 Tax=Caenorhabditis angaria TaxID=860376 RepID=A0A9P1ID89_9PELO|nr:unnamed protein product [Caenorhabditis angaria]